LEAENQCACGFAAVALDWWLAMAPRSVMACGGNEMAFGDAAGSDGQYPPFSCASGSMLHFDKKCHIFPLGEDSALELI
jgi:hypothetical protein